MKSEPYLYELGRRFANGVSASAFSLGVALKRPDLPGRARAATLALSLTLLLAGCDLLSTREPEPPTGNQNNGDLALEPEEVFPLMASAFAVRDPDLYLGLIDEEFQCFASPATYSDPSFFDQWTYNSEVNYIRSLLTPDFLPTDSLGLLEFPETLYEQSWPDSSVYRKKYRLELHTTADEVPVLYEGRFSVTVVRGEDNGWRILRWIDEDRIAGSTWSELRGLLY